jgi:hypothetical protein
MEFLCLRAADGDHVALCPVPGFGSYFYNYLAMANASYGFMYVSLRTNGRIYDDGVIECTDFYKKLQNRALSIPQAQHSNYSGTNLPCVFVGDEAFS